MHCPLINFALKERKEAVWFIPHGSATVLIAVGSINQKVIDIDGQPVSREHLCLSASFDHNIVDGAPAARFMNFFDETVKNGKLVQMELDKIKTRPRSREW